MGYCSECKQQTDMLRIIDNWCYSCVKKEEKKGAESAFINLLVEKSLSFFLANLEWQFDNLPVSINPVSIVLKRRYVGDQAHLSLLQDMYATNPTLVESVLMPRLQILADDYNKRRIEKLDQDIQSEKQAHEIELEDIDKSSNSTKTKNGKRKFENTEYAKKLESLEKRRKLFNK